METWVSCERGLGIEGEFAAQGLPAPVDVGLHLAQRDLEPDGDLLVADVLEMIKHERDPLRGRQRLQGRLLDLPLVGGVQRLLMGVRGSEGVGEPTAGVLLTVGFELGAGLR